MLKLFSGLLVLIILAACSTSPDAPTATSVPTEVEVTVEATPTVTPEPSKTPIRWPTPPPTWTPTPEPTAVPTSAESPTPDEAATRQSEQYSSSALTADCLEFGPDYGQTSNVVTLGEPVTVYWKPAGGPVFYYEVTLTDLNGNQLDMGRTRPQMHQHTFPARLFQPGQIYMWSVTAFDASADVLCNTRTSELRVPTSG